MKIALDKYIFKHFRKLLNYILNNKYFRIVIKGGRSSGKSFFIAMALIIYVCVHDRSVIAILSTKIDVQKRLDNVFIKALHLLGLWDKFRYVQTKHEFIKLNKDGTDSNVSIVCTGADDPERLKGITPKVGSWGLLWIEEATNFDNIKQIKNLESSIGRGDIHGFTSIISYNPRQSTSHFLNIEFNNLKEDDIIISQEYDEETLTSSRITLTEINDDLRLEQLVFHCTYKELIKQGRIDLISPTDLVDIKYGEENNTDYYRWYYLGEACGSDSLNVFRNITKWKIDKKLFEEHCYYGLDFSNGGSDPYHFGCWYYDRLKNDLYCLMELRLPSSASIEDLTNSIKKALNSNNPVIYTDSAVPEFTKQLCRAGLRAFGATKGPDSKYAGVLWLKSMNHIFIDDITCPYTYKEFNGYEYKIDKRTEEVLPELVDGRDHSIDECRYACSTIITDTSYVKRNS